MDFILKGPAQKPEFLKGLGECQDIQALQLFKKNGWALAVPILFVHCPGAKILLRPPVQKTNVMQPLHGIHTRDS